MIKLQKSKLNLLLDGQFGSTGKGLFANYIASHNHIDLAISNAAPNAGHTFYQAHRHPSENKKIVKHLPISGILNNRSTIYLCAGAIINPATLLREVEEFNIDPNRLFIHPNAGVITDADRQEEVNNPEGVKRIASTMNGVGAALARKINRTATLAKDHPSLKQFTETRIDVQQLLKDGVTALMEVPQGMDLSLNHGLAYPYCTSRDITPAQALNDTLVHPKYLGAVCVTIRTNPIRVGNIMIDGEEIGYSGPFHPDSVETSWEKQGLEKEYTTRTNRVRRVASFSHQQYKKMLSIMIPDYVLLNFCNHLSQQDLQKLLTKTPEVTHLGFGPRIENVTLRLTTAQAPV